MFQRKSLWPKWQSSSQLSALTSPPRTTSCLSKRSLLSLKSQTLSSLNLVESSLAKIGKQWVCVHTWYQEPRISLCLSTPTMLLLAAIWAARDYSQWESTLTAKAQTLPTTQIELSTTLKTSTTSMLSSRSPKKLTQKSSKAWSTTRNSRETNSSKCLRTLHWTMKELAGLSYSSQIQLPTSTRIMTIANSCKRFRLEERSCAFLSPFMNLRDRCNV